MSGLRRAYGPNTILDNFSLEVRAGEAVALTGPNGSGKSSPCRRPSTEIQREMATVIADLDFFPDLSVVEHLDLQTRANQAKQQRQLEAERKRREAALAASNQGMR